MRVYVNLRFASDCIMVLEYALPKVYTFSFVLSPTGGRVNVRTFVTLSNPLQAFYYGDVVTRRLAN